MLSFSYILVDADEVFKETSKAADLISSTVDVWRSQPAPAPSAIKVMVYMDSFKPRAVIKQVTQKLSCRLGEVEATRQAAKMLHVLHPDKKYTCMGGKTLLRFRLEHFNCGGLLHRFFTTANRSLAGKLSLSEPRLPVSAAALPLGACQARSDFLAAEVA